MRSLVGVAALLLAGCSLLPSPGPGAYDIHVTNDTTLDVGVRVNGTLVRVVAPADAGVVAASTLPPPPWSVEAVTPGGRVLASITVEPGSVGCTDHPDGSRACRGALGRADLSCGQLLMYVGEIESYGPAPGPGEPGDCAP